MRIPVKAQLNGYTPAFDPFSKNKIVWYKTKIKGIPFTIVYGLLFVMAFIGVIWAFSADEFYQINVYYELGHDTFVLLFKIAAIFGVLGYIWALFVYDLQETKEVSLEESIKLYKQAPLITQDEEYQAQLKLRKNNAWYIIPLSIIAVVYAFTFFFEQSGKGFAGAGLGVYLYLTAILVYVPLYYSTVWISRKYLDHKFGVK